MQQTQPKLERAPVREREGRGESLDLPEVRPAGATPSCSIPRLLDHLEDSNTTTPSEERDKARGRETRHTGNDGHFFSIPAGLNLSLLLKDTELTKPIVLDKFHYLLDLFGRSRLHGNWKHYHAIRAAHLRENVGRFYAETIKNTLLDLGVIETTNSHRAGHYSRGYRLARRYTRDGFRKVLVTDQKLVGRIRRIKSKRIAATIGVNPALAAVWQGVNMVSMDYEAAEAFLRNCRGSKTRLQTLRAQVDAFRDGDFNFSRDRCGRVHHSFAGLSRDLREFTTFQGAPIYVVDMSNLQPALLATLYEKECPEKDRYVELVRSGRFYEFCNNLQSNPIDFMMPGMRDRFKRRVFKYCVYNKNVVPSELRAKFKAEFPVLSARMELIKRTNHAALPILMMKKEASVVIDGVLPELARRFPCDTIISIHDAIACSERIVSEVEEVMRRHFAKVLCFEVPAKTKRISSPVL
jgi:hypothetical protein